jgi:hypothetical protein
MTDMVDKIIDFENGDMDPSMTVIFFGELIKTGLVWELQGSYQRIARRLIEAGVLLENGDVNTENLDALLETA